MKIVSTLFIYIFFIVTAFSQSVDFNNYVPISSRGELPKEFSSSSVEKYLAAKEKIAKDKTKLEKEALNDYELESSFAIDDIFHSGKVIFNDTISTYVNSVMQKLMEQREKKKKVRVFVLRSSVVNAYATGKGVIFITMGLLARMHSEAELAFVLSHEYIHYLKKHAVKGYIENAKAKYDQGKYHNTSIDDKYLRRSNFSKEQELEADELGFDLFSKTSYVMSAPATSLNTIWYYYLPFDSVTFLPSYFEKGSLKIPENYFKNEYTPVDAKEFERSTSKKSSTDDDEDSDESDNYSTHPSTDKRIEKLKEFENGFEGKEARSMYLVSEATFNYIKKLCRFEIPRINLLDGDYEYAMYHAMIMLEKEPNSLYLKKIIAKALYSMARYGNAGHLNEAHIKTKYVQGHFQQLVYLMGKLKAQGLSATAMNYAWQLRSENPEDEELRMICSSLMGSIVRSYERKKNEVFIASYEDTVQAKVKHKKLDESDDEDEVKAKPAKTSKGKSKKTKVKVSDEEDESEAEEKNSKGSVKEFVRRSFIYWFEKDTAFTTLYENKVKDKSAKSIKVKTKKRKASIDLEVNTTDVRWIKKNKVILLDPFYSYYEHKKSGYSTKFDPIKSEQNKSKFTEALIEVASKTFKDYELLDQDQLKTDEAEKLGEITILRDCLLENINKRGIGLVSTDLSLVKQISTKYNSTNLVLTGMIMERNKGQMGEEFCSTIFYSWVLGPIIPIALFRVEAKSYQYTIYTVLYNTTMDDFRVNFHRVVYGKDTPGSLRANLYNIFTRLKTY